MCSSATTFSLSEDNAQALAKYVLDIALRANYSFTNGGDYFRYQGVNNNLFGKGRRERICPLWPETIQLLQALLRRRPRPDDQPIFLNRYGQPLGASGVRFKLSQYVKAATQATPSLAKKDISPHTFRHATAIALIAAGVDIAVVRSWLGHASVDTTAHYAQANLATKHTALARLSAPKKGGHVPRWHRNEDVLTWLDSL